MKLLIDQTIFVGNNSLIVMAIWRRIKYRYINLNKDPGFSRFYFILVLVLIGDKFNVPSVWLTIFQIIINIGTICFYMKTCKSQLIFARSD